MLYLMLANDQGYVIHDGHTKQPKNNVYILDPGLYIYICNSSSS